MVTTRGGELTMRKIKPFRVYVGKKLSQKVAMSRFRERTTRDWRAI
jgi:hypothetical protein